MRRSLASSIVPLKPSLRPSFLPPIRPLHTSFPLLKRRSDSKARHKEEREARKHELEAKLDSAEQWLESHHKSYMDTIQGKQSMLLEETDPFEMDELKERLKDTMDKFRRECASVKQGRSDPEAIRGLMVELPEQLGGRVHFSEIANVGPKPGDARSLLITMFDIEYSKHIVRAIAQKYPHLNPQPSAKNDSQLLIPLPPLTKQTRLDNQKKVKELGEKQKTAVRNIRQDHLKLIKKAAKDDPGMGKDVVTRVEKEVEKEVKSMLEEVEKISEQVQKDIMEA